jgi:extracellular factor (EF) 3-hydroxypalmitic acid methyl ester biosynthesis protein
MIGDYGSQAGTRTPDAPTGVARESLSDLEHRVVRMNLRLQEAVGHFRGNGAAGKKLALRLLKEFTDTALVLESCGWSAERIKDELAPSRAAFATPWFMRRCQEWPRGHPGDFETIEYLTAGANKSLPGTLGWHIEEALLESPVVQQHRNKLKRQALEIGSAITRNKAARVLSIACGGCLDWVPVLPRLKDFAGEIVLNDSDPAAVQLAERRLGSATTRYRLAPGNAIRVVKRLADSGAYDLIVAGGLFDYVSHRAMIKLLRTIGHDLLKDGGILLFTNIGECNPWRPLMEYGSSWTLIERSEVEILEICGEAGIANSSVSVTREDTGLTLITRVER